MSDHPQPYRVRTRPEPRPVALEDQHDAVLPADGASAPQASPDVRPYKVGKNNPPIEKQFVKGVCPNPLGRRGKTKNMKTYVKEAMNTKVTVREGSRIRKMTKAEIGAIKLVNRWTEHGDPKALDKIESLIGEDAVRGAVAPAFDNAEVRQETNRAVLDWYRDTLLRTDARHD